jgi:hypothetical protein
METAREPLHLEEGSVIKWKIMNIPASFVWIIIFLDGTFEYGDGGIFKLLRWIQNLHQSTWDREILYADRSAKDKQHLVIPLLWKTKNTNMAGGWKFKYIFYFILLYFILWRELMNRCT